MTIDSALLVPCETRLMMKTKQTDCGARYFLVGAFLMIDESLEKTRNPLDIREMVF